MSDTRDTLALRFVDGVPDSVLKALLDHRCAAASVMELLRMNEWQYSEPDEVCLHCSHISPNHDENCLVGLICRLLAQNPIPRSRLLRT